MHPENIFNLDDMNVSLYGSSGNMGGRQTTKFYDPNLSCNRNAQINTCFQCTVIFGSNALGQPLTTHFQINIATNIQLRIKIRLDVLKNS